MKKISQIILSIALVVLLQWKGIVFTYLSSLNHPTINCTQRAVTKKIFKHFTLSNLLLSPLIHHKCCQKAITKNTIRKFTLSTLLLSPLIHHKCCQKAITKKPSKIVTRSTLLLSPPIHHKCCLKAITKDLKKFHPFHTVTVTTNLPQQSSFLFLYYHPSSLQESNVVTHCHPFSSLALPISTSIWYT